MARKFQIGDTVEVIKDLGGEEFPLSDDFKIGHRGKITKYNPGNAPHCYVVIRRNRNECCFTLRELKLIKRKGD